MLNKFKFVLKALTLMVCAVFSIAIMFDQMANNGRAIDQILKKTTTLEEVTQAQKLFAQIKVSYE